MGCLGVGLTLVQRVGEVRAMSFYNERLSFTLRAALRAAGSRASQNRRSSWLGGAVWLGFILSFPAFGAPTAGGRDLSSYRLETVVTHAEGGAIPLKGWTLSEIERLKQISLREKSLESGDWQIYRGVLLQELMDQSLRTLTPEKRAQIDLVILKSISGEQALIPRAFIINFPMILSFQKDARKIAASGPLDAVPPWTSKASKIRQESLPVERFFLRGVNRIEFTNYRDRYGSFFLKRRTDPSAIRGEKIFVQNCVTCHASQSSTGLAVLGTPKSRSIAAETHPAIPRSVGSEMGGRGVSGMSSATPSFNEKERRSLKSYFEAFQQEQSSAFRRMTEKLKLAFRK